MNEEKWLAFLRKSQDGYFHEVGCAPDTAPIAIKKHFPPEPKLKMIDIGAGSGEWTLLIREIGHECDALELGRPPRKLDKYIDGDMHDMPIADKTYDAIWCGNTFEHSIAPWVVLMEMNRILKNSGYIVIMIPDDKKVWSKDETHWLIDKDSYRLFIKRAGFRILIDETIGEGGTAMWVIKAEKKIHRKVL